MSYRRIGDYLLVGFGFLFLLHYYSFDIIIAIHSSTMVLAGVIIALVLEDCLATVLDSSSLFYLVFILLLLLSLIWSGILAIVCCDVKSVVAYSTIIQISYIFIALLVNPFLALYHIIIHALFKSIQTN